MQRYTVLRAALCLLLTCAVGLFSLVQYTRAQSRDSNAPPGQTAAQKNDPCSHRPSPPGNAEGIKKRCRAGGSSNGVVKGDFNGDGFADLAIGEPLATIAGQPEAGDVIILYGSADGLTTSGKELWYEGPDRNLPGKPQANDNFGFALASGDFNGDGYSDLAIGVPGKIATSGVSGEVVIIYGSASGLTTSDVNHPPRNFDWTAAKLPTPNCGFLATECDWDLSTGQLGSSLAWGDFNGDGIGDLAVGAPTFSTLRFDLAFCFNGCDSAQGAVWQLFGSTAGLSQLGNRVWVIDDTKLATGSGGDSFGSTLAAGNFNGDSFSDLAIGVPGFSEWTSAGVFGTVGAVLVMSGSTSGLQPIGAQLWTQDSPNIQGTAVAGDDFGSALAAGDFNGDGKSDLAIGTPLKSGPTLGDVGVVNVIYGSFSGLTSTGNQLWDQIALGGTNQADDEFGSALAAGDFNSDGKVDLAIGVPGKNSWEGQVNVIYGSSSELSTSHTPQVWRSSSPQTGAGFGSSLTAWNFGRNESSGTCPGPLCFRFSTADLAIGAPYQNVNGLAEAGMVNVIYGSFFAGGLTSTNRQTFTQYSIGFGNQGGAHFGGSLY